VSSCLQLQLVHHFYGYYIIRTPTIYEYFSYHVLGLESIHEQIVPLDWLLFLFLWFQEILPHHEGSPNFCCFYLHINLLCLKNVIFSSSIFLLLRTFPRHMPYLSTGIEFHYSSSTYSSSIKRVSSTIFSTSRNSSSLCMTVILSSLNFGLLDFS
jgi:hypothetical protein